MTTKDFDTVVSGQVNYCLDLLGCKGEEYAGGCADRLEAFKKAAALQGVNPKQALFGMLAKHLVSVSDMCPEPAKDYTHRRWIEKITDSINYMLLLRALVEEEEMEQINGQD